MVADIGHCYAILYIYICLLFINQVPVCDDDHPSLQHTARQSLRRDPVWGQEPHCEHPGKFAVLWRWRSATSGAPWLRGGSNAMHDIYRREYVQYRWTD